jgi:hypothetical protein
MKNFNLSLLKKAILATTIAVASTLNPLFCGDVAVAPPAAAMWPAGQAPAGPPAHLNKSGLGFCPATTSPVNDARQPNAQATSHYVQIPKVSGNECSITSIIIEGIVFQEQGSPQPPKSSSPTEGFNFHQAWQAALADATQEEKRAEKVIGDNSKFKDHRKKLAGDVSRMFLTRANELEQQKLEKQQEQQPKQTTESKWFLPRRFAQISRWIHEIANSDEQDQIFGPKVAQFLEQVRNSEIPIITLCNQEDPSVCVTITKLNETDLLRAIGTIVKSAIGEVSPSVETIKLPNIVLKQWDPTTALQQCGSITYKIDPATSVGTVTCQCKEDPSSPIRIAKIVSANGTNWAAELEQIGYSEGTERDICKFSEQTFDICHEDECLFFIDNFTIIRAKRIGSTVFYTLIDTHSIVVPEELIAQIKKPRFNWTPFFRIKYYDDAEAEIMKMFTQIERSIANTPKTINLEIKKSVLSLFGKEQSKQSQFDPRFERVTLYLDSLFSEDPLTPSPNGGYGYYLESFSPKLLTLIKFILAHEIEHSTPKQYRFLISKAVEQPVQGYACQDTATQESCLLKKEVNPFTSKSSLKDSYGKTHCCLDLELQTILGRYNWEINSDLTAIAFILMTSNRQNALNQILTYSLDGERDDPRTGTAFDFITEHPPGNERTAQILKFYLAYQKLTELMKLTATQQAPEKDEL